MTDARKGSRIHRALRGVWFALGAVLCMLLLRSAGAKLTEPESPIQYYAGEPAAPRVFVRGTLQRLEDSELPALCAVTYEQYETGAKSEYWATKSRMTAALATLDVEWSSPPAPSSMSLSSGFAFGYRLPALQVADSERAGAWERQAQAAGIEPLRAQGALLSTGRIAERCLDAGESVFIEACVSPSNAARLEPCSGHKTYLVVPGGIRPVITRQASGAASRVGWAALALLVGLLPLLRKPAPLIEGLAGRALLRSQRHPRPYAAWAWALVFGVCIVALLAMIDDAPPLWWIRTGFLWAVIVLGFWLFAALRRRSSGSEMLSALAPVLDTPRSLLAHATGTVELAVRARMRTGGVKSFIGDDVVAFSQLRITEVYIGGRPPTPASHVVFLRQEGDDLEVVDESGDGVLHLADAILDTEVRRARMRRLPPRYTARGIPARGTASLYYLVEERVIRDGEPLYVYGDVSGVALRPGEAGYRSVRGAPTLGGAGTPPVLVYAGDERGLIAMIVAHARQAKSVGIAAVFAVAVFGAALAYLAWL